MISISYITLNTHYRLTTSECIAPAMKLPLKIRLVYHTIFSTFHPGCLIRMSNLTYSKLNSMIPVPPLIKLMFPSVHMGNHLGFFFFVTSHIQFKSKSCVYSIPKIQTKSVHCTTSTLWQATTFSCLGDFNNFSHSTLCSFTLPHLLMIHLYI